LELRLELEGAQRNAVTSTNRIIQLEADASATRHRLRITDVENGDLRDEVGVASERVYALEDELVAVQGRLDSAESTIRRLRLELERYAHTSARLPNYPPIKNGTQDVNDTDSVSDEGSTDTLVMDPDEHPQLRSPSSGVKDVDSPTSANQNEQFSNNLTPLSVRALEARLEAMTLKYKAAEAARICGEDVEDILRAKLQTLSKDDLCVDTRFPIAPPLTKTDFDEHADTPLGEWHSLPTIPEEDEPNISPTLERVTLPRIQTSTLPATKKVARVPTRSDRTPEPASACAESPLLPSPTLSDIWFSDLRVSLALIETGSSVMGWDLPSPGGDSDGS